MLKKFEISSVGEGNGIDKVALINIFQRIPNENIIISAQEDTAHSRMLSQKGLTDRAQISIRS